ncbi:FecR domain-containing protein [Sphingomonas endophytica]|uniref:Transmembrane sensor n=1 Tax=Sphingomonas endophytica TaxID=869719 RepID=A0ABR6N4U1_9SPHN|nr:DUF4880 domain-containing protein [Sphingomonas endophytica]MBB5725798.1 transmembrane sensor [Sphingomonas endophytica]
MTDETDALPAHVVDEAIGWMMAIREDALTAAERLEFEAWLTTDHRHLAAWHRLDGALAPFRSVAAHISGAALAASLEQQRVSRRTVLRKGAGAVAGSAFCLATVDRFVPLVDAGARFRTNTAQRKQYPLPDGSVLTLDARSAADAMADDRRGLSIREGTALITAAPSAQPFTVTAGALHVTWPRGTAMIVHRAGDSRVVAIDQPIVVTLGDRLTNRAHAGEGFALVDGALRQLAANETLDASSWVQGSLLLHDRPLGSLIAALRPYQPGILAITDAAASLRISGVFDLARIDSTLDMIVGLLPVRVRRIGSLFRRIEPLAG